MHVLFHECTWLFFYMLKWLEMCSVLLFHDEINEQARWLIHSWLIIQYTTYIYYKMSIEVHVLLYCETVQMLLIGSVFWSDRLIVIMMPLLHSAFTLQIEKIKLDIWIWPFWVWILSIICQSLSGGLKWIQRLNMLSAVLLKTSHFILMNVF